MNTGLSNLTTLKNYLLAPSLLAQTKLDAKITALGLAVAGAIEKFCNRQFAFLVGDSFTCNADRTSIVLPRYPLSTASTGVTALAIRTDLNSGFVDQGNPFNLILDLGQESGLVDFGVWGGPLHARFQFTYDGGLFWETLEPTDVGYPTTPPAGSTPIPASLQGAWLLACDDAWRKMDKLGAQILEGAEKQHTIRGLDESTFPPLVRTMLAPHVRFAMT